jgi:hypothetical protein
LQKVFRTKTHSQSLGSKKEGKKERELPACRAEGSAVGPVLAAHALLLRCAC